MKLYDADRAPSPRRVRIYLAEKAISVERVAVDLRAGEHLQPAYLAINPRGTVPALQLDDGEVIGDSVAICRFFEALHPDPPLFGARPVEIARIAVWTRRIEAEGYAGVVYALRNTAARFAGRAETGRWPPLEQIPALAERGRAMWGAFVETLDSRLGESEWIGGDRYSFADISALTAVDFATAAGLGGAGEAANVMRWYESVAARPSAAA
ncbi:glutathione S-transferase [Sphingomonas sp. Leaf231]|uniref:glutathione S-transferase family protein n=1 Tax=Sphingomonas sp. Leaf231 TaxID=1736301 RepID=UPI0006F80F9A|nr:glutathione S-transferase N-terminal domain-containing protein [Sphingomonas sp. Leaf231]KQN92847.1 glutathione S-transferase [Sphingomonas sp. Leaf231]